MGSLFDLLGKLFGLIARPFKAKKERKEKDVEKA